MSDWAELKMDVNVKPESVHINIQGRQEGERDFEDFGTYGARTGDIAGFEDELREIELLLDECSDVDELGDKWEDRLSVGGSRGWE